MQNLFIFHIFIGHQSSVFNSMSTIYVGGKIVKNGRNIEAGYVGVIAGLSINKLRVLDVAAERDPHVQIRGEVQLVTGVLEKNDLQRMQQVREGLFRQISLKSHSKIIFIIKISNLFATNLIINQTKIFIFYNFICGFSLIIILFSISKILSVCT